MAKYYKEYGLTKKQRWARRLRPLIFVVLFAALVLGGWFLYDLFRQNNASNTASVLSKPVSSTIVSNKQIMSSPYFQFQTPEKWRAVANETREGHYVYRQFNGPLVEQELVIDINNQTPEILATTLTNRVIPVTAAPGGTLQVVNNELERCNKAVKPGTEKQQQMVTAHKVTFPCNPEYTGYEAVVGLVGGSNKMTLKRPDGSTAIYKILYRNVTATPTSRDILGIIKTFETR